MKCKKCNHDNRACASYCKNCGFKFTEKEQNEAKSKTLEGILVRALEAVDKLKSILNLSIIIDKTWFKIISIIVVLGIGICSCIENGYHIRLLESKSYQINYNKSYDEYYLLVNDKEAKLNLYIPYRNQDVIVRHMEGDEELSSNVYKNGSDISLISNGQRDYYLIIGKNLKGKSETLKIFIYKGMNLNETKE